MGWIRPPCTRWKEKAAAVAVLLQPKTERNSAKKRPKPKTVPAVSVAMVKQAPTMYQPKKIGARPPAADWSAMGVPPFGGWWGKGVLRAPALSQSPPKGERFVEALSQSPPGQTFA